MDSVKVDVIIPTFHPKERFLALMEQLEKQVLAVNRIVIVNTEKKAFEALMDCETFLKEHEVMIAALTLPKSKAVKVAEKLVDLGIKALWNFAPVDLHFSEDILVENVHLAESIMTLSYRIHSQNQ